MFKVIENILEKFNVSICSVANEIRQLEFALSKGERINGTY